MSISEFPRTRGFRLGPPISQFNEDSLVLVEGTRDTYFSANPSKLALYDNDTSLMIRLTYLDELDVPQTKYQIRVAGEWLDYTPVVQGPPGDAASLDSVPVGEIPYKTNMGTFAGSNMRVLEDGRLLAPPGFTVESGSVTFGEAITLSEISGFLGVSNHLNGREYTVVDFWTPPDNASSPPSIFHLIEPAFEFTAQGTDTTNLPDNPLSFNYTVQNTARSRALKFRTYAAMSNVRMRVSLVSNGVVLKHIPNQQAWEEGTGGLNWGLGDNSYEFGDTSLNLQAGQELHFELHATSVALKGNALGVPYFTAIIQRGEFRDVITDAVYTATDVRTKLESLSGNDRLSATELKDVVTSVNTRTGDVVLTSADVNLNNVDNTSDINKPVSTAQSTAIVASMATHNAAPDPHPQYTTLAKAQAAAPVQSVNTLQGNVVLTTANIAESGNLYYSDSRVTNYLVNNGYTVKSASSIGSGSAIYKQNSVGNLEFRSVIGTGSISVTQNANDLTISAPAITSGTYSPNLFNTTNVANSSSFQAQYVRVGNIVTVSGKVIIDPTNNNQITTLGVSIPIASNLANQEDLAGCANCPAVAGQSSAIYADATNDRAVLEFVSGSNSSQSFFYIYQYEVI